MQKFKLKDICEVITKGTTPTTFGFSFIPSGINFIKSEQIQNARSICYNSKFFISENANKKLNRSMLKQNDILMSIAGAYLGKIAICQDKDLPANTNQAVGIIRLKSNYDYKYVYYLLTTKKIQNYIKNCNAQSAQPNINLEQIGNIVVNLPSLPTQQHIVDSIGSVDDAIEKNEEVIDKIKTYGNNLFDTIDIGNCIDVNNIMSFEKGIEIGSSNYFDKEIENSLPYIRVGNLSNNVYDTYCLDNNYKKCNYDDILIAFDGAPGRNSIGLYGVYSSGINKIICDSKIKGFIYFYINSNLCQNTIKQNSQGTTILHASKSIKLLKIPNIKDEFLLVKFNNLYNIMIDVYKKQIRLKHIKQLLLNKFFD